MYILGTKVNFDINREEALKKIDDEILSKDIYGEYICTTNPEFIMSSQDDPEFKTIINNSFLSLPDGVGVLYAKEYLRRVSEYPKDFLSPFRNIILGLLTGIHSSTKQERITGVSFTEDLCNLANEKGYNVFFLGGWPKDNFGRDLVGDYNLAGEVATHLKVKYPNMNVIGATSSFKSNDFVNSVTYIQECMRSHNTNHIDILFVAYGFASQHKWISHCAKNIPAKVSMGVGGTFDYISGRKKQTPGALMRLNLDWLYRLITQPWRLRRILTAILKFPMKVYLTTLRS